MTLALTGGTVVAALDPPRVVAADVLVEDGRIAAVGPSVTRPGVARRDCSGCLLVPGNVCAHTHLYSALSPGMPFDLEPPRTFLEILQRVWWRLDRALDEEAIRMSALVGGAAALLAGTTTLVDHHASPNAADGSLDVLADALGGLGLRAVLCYETSDRDGPAVARAGIRENVRFLARARTGAYPLARAMVGAHASFTLSDETLAACAEAAATDGVGLHVHVAEDAVDERDCLGRHGRRVVERLAAAGALTERALLAHAVHVEAVEAALIRGAGATVAHNARSNMHNAVGRPPLDLLGEAVALGTDGIGADMVEESRAAYLRRREEAVTVSPAWTLARLAEGARFAGRAFGEPALGRLEPGAPADLAVLAYDPPTPLSAASLGGHWVFGVANGRVRDVLVAGEVVVGDGRLTRLEEAALAAEARAVAGRLWARLERIAPHPFEPGSGPWREPASAKGRPRRAAVGTRGGHG
ncbi:MAG TPA: amidohydrolase family protein [Candidatus Limnocylindrales bacterium]